LAEKEQHSHKSEWMDDDSEELSDAEVPNIRVHSVQAEDVMIMTCSQVLAGQNVEGESKLEEQDEV
jgi:hypothetical protein